MAKDYEEIELGWRIYKNKKKAELFVALRKKKGYMATMYETMGGKEWGVTY